jgi:hypothetical protein
MLASVACRAGRRRQDEDLEYTDECKCVQRVLVFGFVYYVGVSSELVRRSVLYVLETNSE